jgi:hypothetical protein
MKYEKLIRTGQVHTWADGFGRWRVSVPATMAAPKLVAVNAIWHELRIRETKTDGTVPCRPSLYLIHENETEQTWGER